MYLQIILILLYANEITEQQMLGNHCNARDVVENGSIFIFYREYFCLKL